MNRSPQQRGRPQDRAAPPSPLRSTAPPSLPPSPTTEARRQTIADQDDRLWKIINDFLARLKESPPKKAITPAQLNALLNHTQGNGWKGFYAFVKGQSDKDKRNRLAGEKEGRRPEDLEGRHEKFWLLLQETLDGGLKDLRSGLSEEKDRALARIVATALVAKMRMELLLNPSLYEANKEPRERQGR